MEAQPLGRVVARSAMQDQIDDLLTRLSVGANESDQTVDEYLSEWLESRRSRVAPSTHVGYRTMCRYYILPYLGDLQLQAVTVAVLSS